MSHIWTSVPTYIWRSLWVDLDSTNQGKSHALNKTYVSFRTTARNIPAERREEKSHGFGSAYSLDAVVP
jgi:hypothetical protein